MDMLTGEQIGAADLSDWRKLAQGLHARYRLDDLSSGAQFLAEVANIGDDVETHLRVAMGPGYVDLKLISDDAVYREDDGTEHVVEWPTQRDVELASRITQIAGRRGLHADPGAVSVIELGLDATNPAAVAAVWAALLTGDPGAQGRGTPSEEVRDASARVPNLWFGGPPADPSAQRVHIEVYVPPEVVEQRLAAAIAAGGTVADDGGSPSLTVIADQEGNTCVLCADTSSAKPR